MFNSQKSGALLFLGTLFYLFTMQKTFAQPLLPEGAMVLKGDASIVSGGKSMMVSSGRSKNIISWNSFNVGEDHNVFFDSNHYLNLVRGTSPSIIAGTISQSENGGSFTLINPNGITLTASGNLNANHATLSTAKVTEALIDNFMESGNVIIEGPGMGKIKVNGTVHVNSLTLNGSQVIIRDLGRIKNRHYRDDMPGNNRDEQFLKITSSTHRIDVGGDASVNLEEFYGFYAKDGYVSHLGATPVSTREEFLKIVKNPDGDYFLTDDIDLGTLDEPLLDNTAFKGTLDGAFNSIGYAIALSEVSYENVGLFSEIDEARILNLKIDKSSISIKKPNSNLNLGGLGGRIRNSVLHNLEVTDFDVAIDEPKTYSFNIGGIGGSMDGNRISNITASLSSDTIDHLSRSRAYNAGSISGIIRANLQEGVISSRNGLREDNALKLYGTSSDGSHLAATPLDNEGFLSVNADEYLSDDGYFTLKGFYAPYFIDEDISITYDTNSPQTYNYTNFVDNTYFHNDDFVKITYDYEGDIRDPLLYTHTYESRDDGVRFYFQKGDRSGFTLEHLDTVKDPRIIEEADPSSSFSSSGSHNTHTPPYSESEYDKDQPYKNSVYDLVLYQSTLSFYNRLKSARTQVSRGLMTALLQRNTDEVKEKTGEHSVLAQNQEEKKDKPKHSVES